MTYFNKRPKTNKQTKSNIETCLNARDEKMHCTFWFHWHWHEMNEPWLLQVFCESNGCWCGNNNQYHKIFAANITPKWDINQPNFKQKLYQTIPEHASLPKTCKKNSSPKTISREISTTLFFHENRQTSKLVTLTNIFSAGCISSEFCQVDFLLWLFQTFWWRCFFIFLVETFLQVFFSWTCFFIFCLVGRCL